MTLNAQKTLFAIAISTLILVVIQSFGSLPEPTRATLAIITVMLILVIAYYLIPKPSKETSPADVWSIDANALADAIFVTDMNGHVMGMNQQFRALVPRAEDAKDVVALLKPLHALALQQSQADDVVSAVKSSPDIKFTDRLKLSDGREIERTTRPIEGTGDRIWILSDVTQAVTAGNDSAMHQTMIEEDAARTAELAEQLYHAKSELEQKQTELTRLANTDPMTGLFNRRRFLSLAEEAIQNTEDKNSLWVIMFDIDHFKRVNDTFGHAAGDVAIRDFANLISDAMGKRDFIGRMGGEEFAAILTECSADQAYRIAELIRRNTASNKTISDSAEFRFTTSVGVAPWLPTELSIEPALDRADKALYNAKIYGRNRVVGYE